MAFSQDVNVTGVSDGLLTDASMLEQELNEKCAHDWPNMQLRLTR